MIRRATTLVTTLTMAVGCIGPLLQICVGVIDIQHEFLAVRKTVAKTLLISTATRVALNKAQTHTHV
jgi:hypothetical protein